jgi:uncharacterized protein
MHNIPFAGMIKKEIFIIPVMDNYLLYAPLASFVSLVNQTAVHEIRSALTLNETKIHSSIQPIVQILNTDNIHYPQPLTDAIRSPFFLGLVTTRNCNMGCVYCDFAASKKNGTVMSLSTAKNAIDSYFSILINNHQKQAHVHFFGGEPFYSPEIVDFSVNYTNGISRKYGMEARFEIITNGFFDPDRAYWAGNTFNTIVLSLDGPGDIQDRNRPGLNGRNSFTQVYEVAKILSKSPTNFIIRSCITDDMVDRIPEIAKWISREFLPNVWCIEPLTTGASLRKERLKPPDPWKFSRNFLEATRILEKVGVRVVNSTVELEQPQITCCPVGRDALIVSPDGSIDACYLLERDWLDKGINMRFGKIDEGVFCFSEAALDQIRQLNVFNRTLCQDCFCKYSCAGGCHVNHTTNAAPGTFDDLCIYTRLITISKLLKKLGQEGIADSWWRDPHSLKSSIMQPSDRFLD